MQVIRVVVVVAMLVAVGRVAHADGLACIPADQQRRGRTVEIAGDRVRYCVDRAGVCLTLDADNMWSLAPAPKRTTVPAKPAAAARVTLSTTATVCTAEHRDCHTFTTAYAPMDDDLGVHVVANADRSVVVVGHDRGIVIFDGKTSAQRGTIAYWDPDNMPNMSITFVGDHILVWGTNGSTGVARLYDADAKVVADLGAVEDPSIALDDGALAYLTAHAAAVELRDRTGKLMHATKLPAPLQTNVSIGLFAYVPSTQQLVVVSGKSISLVDPGTGTLTAVAPPPSCP